MNPPLNPWKRLDRISPTALLDARLELHHAAQLVAIGIGRSLVPSRSDDGHTTLTWRGATWWSEAIPGGEALRAGLRPEGLELVLGDERLGLIGKTRQQGLDWLRGQLGALGLDGDAAALDIHYDLPDHPVAGGACFRAELGPGFEQLAAWYGAADGLLREMATQYGGSPVVTWPHHFDSATLLTLDPTEAGDKESGEEAGRSIGIGLSPGDGNFAQPYFYVTPWPVPAEDPAELPLGFWTREKFFGAILTGEDLLAAGGDPEDGARRYLETAISGGLRSLGARD